MYAEYGFYAAAYGGTIITDEVTFRRIEQKAGAYLEQFTFGRIVQADEKVRLAVCEMADVLYQAEERTREHNGLEIASENNDGYSVTYAGAKTSRYGSAELRKELYDTAYTYLAHTGLMDWSVEK